MTQRAVLVSVSDVMNLRKLVRSIVTVVVVVVVVVVIVVVKEMQY
jgi:hypothetical protein